MIEYYMKKNTTEYYMKHKCIDFIFNKYMYCFFCFRTFSLQHIIKVVISCILSIILLPHCSWHT